MKLRLIMMLIISPLLLTAGYYAQQVYTSDRALSLSSRQTVASSIEQAIIAELIHELQKERGFSAGFISSGGANFRPDLARQQEMTDEKVRSFQAGTPSVEMRDPGMFSDVETALQAITAMRRNVSEQSITVPSMAGFYTSIINDLMHLSYPEFSDTTSSAVATLKVLRTLLTATKESAGLERAMGATGLGGGFSPSVAERYLKLQGAQLALLSQSERMLQDDGVQDDLYQSEAFQALQAARLQVATGMETGDFGGLTAPEWFQISTAWIERLREAEADSTQKINGLALKNEKFANAHLQTTIWFGIGSLIFVGLFSTFIFEMMIRRIKALTYVVNGFAKGDFSIYVPGIDRRDEISRMARAIYHFKQETLALRREAEAMKAEDEASLNAKHGRVLALMSEGLAALARADLSIRFDQPLEGDQDQVRQDFNEATGRLRDVLLAIAATATDLDRSSDDMKTSALDLCLAATSQTPPRNPPMHVKLQHVLPIWWGKRSMPWTAFAHHPKRSERSLS